MLDCPAAVLVVVSSTEARYPSRGIGKEKKQNKSKLASAAVCNAGGIICRTERDIMRFTDSTFVFFYSGVFVLV